MLSARDERLESEGFRSRQSTLLQEPSEMLPVSTVDVGRSSIALGDLGSRLVDTHRVSMLLSCRSTFFL